MALEQAMAAGEDMLIVASAGAEEVASSSWLRQNRSGAAKLLNPRLLLAVILAWALGFFAWLLS